MNRVLAEVVLPSGLRLQLVHGDLTLEETDAIVNAANAYLLHGGGVAGAICERGGESIQRESDAWVRRHGPVTHDAPAWTGAGRLACRYVIHAVGPAWGDGDEDRKLRAAVSGALKVAEQLQLTSLSLPAISTGIFGFPRDRAANIILDVLRVHTPGTLKLVRLVLFDAPTLTAFQAAWRERFPA